MSKTQIRRTYVTAPSVTYNTEKFDPNFYVYLRQYIVEITTQICEENGKTMKDTADPRGDSVVNHSEMNIFSKTTMEKSLKFPEKVNSWLLSSQCCITVTINKKKFHHHLNEMNVDQNEAEGIRQGRQTQ